MIKLYVGTKDARVFEVCETFELAVGESVDHLMARVGAVVSTRLGKPTQIALAQPTKREMFAAMAMQGLISNPALRAVPDATAQEATQVIMRGAVRFADALIAELAK